MAVNSMSYMDFDNLVVDVYLKDGDSYTGCDLLGPSGSVLSNEENWVKFLDFKGRIIMIPASEVEQIVLRMEGQDA